MPFRKMRFVFSVFIVTMIFSGSVWAEKNIQVQDTEHVVKININKATAQELAALKRIGPKIAERIILYREKQGAFNRPEEIMNVKGIGKKTYELNKDLIAIK